MLEFFFKSSSLNGIIGTVPFPYRKEWKSAENPLLFSPHPALRELAPAGRLIAEPRGRDQFAAVPVVVRNAAGPAGFCMDAGAADAGIIK